MLLEISSALSASPCQHPTQFKPKKLRKTRKRIHSWSFSELLAARVQALSHLGQRLAEDFQIMKIASRYKYELSILLFWAVVVVSKIRFDGLVFGFDYGVYQPDGKFYTYMALDFFNHNPADSAKQVVDWYAVHGFKMNTFTIQDLMPATSYAYPIISHRILYPLLSAPFVALLGIPGMLVIPALSLLVLMLSVQRIAAASKKPLVGFLIVLVLANSSTVLRWMIVNCTDSLLAGLFALVPFCIFKLVNKKKYAIIQLAILIILTSATRFILPVWLGVLFVLFMKKIYRREMVILGVLSIISSIPALSAQLSTALLPASTSTPTYLKIIQLPIVFLKVIAVDILEFGVLDRVLLLMLIITSVQAIRLRQNLSSMLFWAVLVSTYLIGAINGTLGVNFRYQMPVLVFCAWVLIDSFEVSGGGLRFVSPVKRDVIINKAK